jgi:hypothetical protein
VLGPVLYEMRGPHCFAGQIRTVRRPVGPDTGRIVRLSRSPPACPRRFRSHRHRDPQVTAPADTGGRGSTAARSGRIIRPIEPIRVRGPRTPVADRLDQASFGGSREPRLRLIITRFEHRPDSPVSRAFRASRSPSNQVLRAAMHEFLLPAQGRAQGVGTKKFMIFPVVHRRGTVIPKQDPVVHGSTHKLIFHLWTARSREYPLRHTQPWRWGYSRGRRFRRWRRPTPRRAAPAPRCGG